MIQATLILASLHFSLLVSMAPLSNEIRPVTSCCPPHFGPAVPEVNSVWFKLFIYDQVKSGPPSLLLVKGTRLRWLPKIFEVIVTGVLERKIVLVLIGLTLAKTVTRELLQVDSYS